MNRTPETAIISTPTGTIGAGEFRNRLRGLLASTYPGGKIVERRKEPRYPYPNLVTLTPVAADGVTLEGTPIVVCGKQISESGIGFYHPEPLPYRRMIVSLELGVGRWLDLLVELTWCRFTRHGWYEGGGRFLNTSTAINRAIEKQP